MKFAVMGTGGIGAFIGARLAQAGHDVSFVARGAHLEAIRETGLTLTSTLGDIHVAAPPASADPADLQVPDAVIFTVKGYDTEEAAELMQPLVGPETIVVSFQNGVESVKRLARFFPRERVYGSITYVPAVVDAPGVVRHTGEVTRCIVGARAEQDAERIAEVAEAMRAGGIETELSDDIERDLWHKFVTVGAFSAVCGITRLPLGPMLADPETKQLLQDAMQEIVDVGRTYCATVDPGIAAKQLAFATEHASPETRASQLEDLARGKRIELENLSGAVVRLGHAAGVATPVHDTVYRALHPYLNGVPDGA
jgi:2-dehydropantoate 2-reductase